MNIRRRLLQTLACAALPALGTVSHAQSDAYPSKPIRWVVGYPAGSGMDAVARTVGEALGKSIGQPVIIDNKSGAAGALAAKEVAGAPGDGYTLLNVDMGTYTLNPHLYPKLPYDPRRDFKMVVPLVTLPMVLYVPASLPVNNVQEFVRYVKSQPAGSINFASSGMGNPVHLTMELFMRQAGISMTHVPYRGSPAAMQDLIGGQVLALFNDPNTGMPHVKSGKLKVLGVATPKRIEALTDVPTMGEQGFPVDLPVWVGLAVPTSTPQAVVERLNGAINDVMRSPDVATRMGAMGFTISPRGTSQQMDEFARKQLDALGVVLQPMNIKLE
jgi:tripartite-type tricarboxylate transporter receptor subunit TctC